MPTFVTVETAVHCASNYSGTAWVLDTEDNRAALQCLCDDYEDVSSDVTEYRTAEWRVRIRRAPTSEVLHRLKRACERGALGEALGAADELCRPERAGTCSERMSHVRGWTSLAGYSEEQLQGLQDRIDQYNSYCAR